MIGQLQKDIILKVGVKPTIDAVQEIRQRIDFLKNLLVESGFSGFVLGISGGQDSALAGKLAQLAVNELNEATGEEERKYTFLALRLPYGIQHDENDAQAALAFIQPSETEIFNIKSSVDAVVCEYGTGEKWIGYHSMLDYNKGNVKARMRMIAQYAYGSEKHLLVVGTENSDEFVTGFFTKWGDAAADLVPLSGLNKRQGQLLLQKLGAPKQLYLKAPTADLLDHHVGQTDEDELGVSYEDIDDYLEGKVIVDTARETIEARYLASQHKMQPPIPFS